jgi:hypothetical protein
VYWWGMLYSSFVRFPLELMRLGVRSGLGELHLL